MSDMLKMNNATNQKLKMQAREMGIDWKKAELRYDNETGYYIKGWKERKKSGEMKAVDNSLKGKIKSRKEKIDKESGY